MNLRLIMCVISLDSGMDYCKLGLKNCIEG